MITILNVDMVQTSVEALGMTDSQIAIAFGVSRTAVVHFRRNHDIKRELKTGRKGELLFLDEVKRKLMNVLDMNEMDSLSSFDFMVNGKRVEVKTASHDDRGCFRITLTESGDKGCLVGENRIRLTNGRTRKRYADTCDVLVFICLRSKPEVPSFYLMDSSEIPEEQQTISIFPNNKDSKYEKYRENWEL